MHAAKPETTRVSRVSGHEALHTPCIGPNKIKMLPVGDFKPFVKQLKQAGEKRSACFEAIPQITEKRVTERERPDLMCEQHILAHM